MKTLFKRISLDLFLYLGFLLLVLPVLFSELKFGCLSSYDLGIFSQILQAGWRFEWDPFVGIRESFLIQDHWDPITNVLGFLTFPVKFFWNAPQFLMWFEASLIFLTALVLRNQLRKFHVGMTWPWLGFLVVLFSRPTWNALMFPVHPAVWALLWQVLLFAWAAEVFLLDHRPRWFWLFGASLVLWICGEQFSLALCSWALVLLIFGSKYRRMFAVYFILCLLGAWWAMNGRILVHGSIYDHGARLSFSLFEVWSKYQFDRDFFRRLTESFVGFLPGVLVLISLLRASRGKKVHRPSVVFLLAILGFSAPLILGRLLSNSWGSQYGVVVTGLVVGFLFLKSEMVLSKRLAYVLTGLVIFTTVGDWKKSFALLKDPRPNCDARTGSAEVDDWKKREEELKRGALMLPQGSRVLGGCYINTAVLALRDDLKLHMLGPFQQIDQETPIDYIWLSRGAFDNNWPLTGPQIDQVLVALSPSEVYEFQSSVLLRGPFDPKIFQPFQGTQRLRMRDSGANSN